MANNSEKLDITNIFAKSIYYIPSMQRRYDWTDKNASQTADDLYQEYLKCIEEKLKLEEKKYYFYDISRTKHPVIPGDGNTIYEVNDGIQRLTTIIIFCYAIWFFCIANNLSTKTIDFIRKDLEEKFIYNDRDRKNTDHILRTRIGYNKKDFPNLEYALDRITLLPVKEVQKSIDGAYSFVERSKRIKDLIRGKFPLEKEVINLRFMMVFEKLYDRLSNFFAFPEIGKIGLFDNLVRQEIEIQEERLKDFFDWILDSIFEVRTITYDQQNSEFRKKNNRGLGLSATSLLKAEISEYLKEDEKAEFSEVWLKMENCIEKYVIEDITKKNDFSEKIKEYDKKFEEILKSFAVVYYVDPGDPNIANKDTDSIYDFIVDKEQNKNFKSSYLKPKMNPNGLKYAKFFYNFVNSYLNLQKSLLPNGEESIDLREFKYWQRKGSVSNRDMLMTISAWPDKYQRRFIKVVVKTIFMRAIFIDENLTKDKIDETFNKCIKILRKTVEGEEENSIIEIEKILDKKVYNDYINKNFDNVILRYVKDDTQKEKNDEKESSDKPRSGTNVKLRYILYRTDHYIGQIRKDLIEIGVPVKEEKSPYRDDKIFRNAKKTEDETITYTIEHIAVQGCKLKKDKWPNIEKDFDEHDIGNLILLTNKQNSAVTQLNFDEKRIKYREYTEWNLAQNIAGNIFTTKSGTQKKFADSIPKFKIWNKESVQRNRKYILENFLLSMGYNLENPYKQSNNSNITNESKIHADYLEEMTEIWKEIKKSAKFIEKEKISEYLIDLKIFTKGSDMAKYSGAELEMGMCALKCTQILIDKIEKIEGINNSRGILYKRMNMNFPKYEDYSKKEYKSEELLIRFRNIPLEKMP